MVEAAQNAMQTILLSLGCSVFRTGPAKNVYLFSHLADFFEAGSQLFKQGYSLYSPADYAKKSGVTRQAVDNWLWRDGQRIALKFERKGRNLLFIIE